MTTHNVLTTKERIVTLQEEVLKHDRLYDLNKPIISDSDYDKLYQELVTLEKQHPEFVTPESPTQRVVSMLVTSLEKVIHSSPMLSQDKVHSASEILEFARQSTSDILGQLKLDGLTIVLTYEGGRKRLSVTRGDGFVGENVSHTIQTSSDVPSRISFKGKLEIRAEAIITYADFERINVDGTYASTRNLASGTVRQLDANVAKERNIRVIAFDLVSAEGMTFKTDVEMLEFMTEQGFNVVPYKVFKNTPEGLDELITYCETFNETQRKLLGYAIDGLVLKFDDLQEREELGYTSKYPRWGCAFKFEAENATTKLKSVLNQVGKTGQITPVGLYDFVDFDGAKNDRASLYNYNRIAERDIRIGDTIVVERANDVIPKVVQSIKDLRTGNEQVIEPPAFCPSCGSPTEMDGENLYCTGLNCIPQLEGKLIHFVSRKALNIDGIGKETVKTLLEKGLISSFTDIFRLHEKESAIISLEKFGQTSFDNMIKGIEKSKQSPLHKVIGALSIRNIGEGTSKDLAKAFATMDEIMELATDSQAFLTKLLSLDAFGETKSTSLMDFFTNELNRETIRELQRFGFTMENEYQQTVSKGNSLEGKSFVITGSFSKGRDELKDIIESYGGKAMGSVSKKTTYLLMGDGVEGKSKHTKAIDLGVEILSEEAFNELIKG